MKVQLKLQAQGLVIESKQNLGILLEVFQRRDLAKSEREKVECGSF
jgi:hypothetical protein